MSMVTMNWREKICYELEREYVYGYNELKRGNISMVTMN